MRLVALLYLAALACVDAQGAVTLFVSPQGRDDWPGTHDRPFASVQRARDALRELRAAGRIGGPVTVYLRDGMHVLSETLVLGPEDSGTPRAPVIYRAYPGETPTLTGGQAVGGFVPYQGQILRTDVSAQIPPGQRPELLVCAGQRQERARTPNRDPDDPNGGRWAFAAGERMEMYADRPDEEGYLAQHPELDFWQRNIPRYRRLLPMRPEDVLPWEHPEDGEVYIFPRFNWSHYLLPIESFDAASRTMHLGEGSFYEIRPGDRYFVRGHLEDLDSPGEWYLDPRTSELYFWPPEPLAGRPVYIPVITHAVTLTHCSDVTLQGFTIECCAGSGVVLQDCHRVTIAANTIRNVGGVDGVGVSVEGGSRNRIVGNDIYDTGSSGIRLGGGDAYRLELGRNEADNNHIHHVGRVGRQANGVQLYWGAGNRVSHNLIHDIPHSGILMWGPAHTIEYNRLVRTCLESEDCGAIGGGAIDWLSWQGAVIRYNWIQDTVGFGYDQQAQCWRSPYFAHALYPDWAASGVRIVGNILVRAPVSLLYLHSGRDNLIDNNVLIEGGQQQLTWTGWTTGTGFWSSMVDGWIRNYETAAKSPAWQRVRTLRDPRAVPLADGRVMHGNVFRHNIVFFRSPQAALVQVNDVSLDHNEADWNLYYHSGRPLTTGVLRARVECGPNLLVNPGLEQGPVGELPAQWAWGLKATERTRLEVVEGEAHTGTRSLLIEPASVASGTVPPTGYIAPGAPQTFRPGQAYRLAAWMRAEGGPIGVALQAYSWERDTHNWSVSQTVSPTTEWRPYELVFRLPERTSPDYRATMATFLPRIAFTAGPGKVWVDDLSLREVEALSEWESWQAAGMDRHSLIADPLFVDAAHDDYRLRPESPALQMGFRPIPTEKIGCYRSPLRASWPVTIDPSGR